ALKGEFNKARQIYQTSGWIHRDLGEMERIAAQTEFFSRDFSAAEKLYDDLSKSDPAGGCSFYSAVDYQSAVGRAKQALGEGAKGQTLLNRCLIDQRRIVAKHPDNPEANYCLAAVESCLGISDSSLEHLRAAARLGWTDYRSLTLDPRFDSVRRKPEFQQITNTISAKVAEMRLKDS